MRYSFHFIGNDYKGLDESRDVVLELINNELEKGIPPARIMIGGFSQGAVVSLHTAIQYKGVCLLINLFSSFINFIIFRF